MICNKYRVFNLSFKPIDDKYKKNYSYKYYTSKTDSPQSASGKAFYKKFHT